MVECPGCLTSFTAAPPRGDLLRCPRCPVRFPHPEARSIPLGTQDLSGAETEAGILELTPLFRERYQLVRFLGSGALGSVFQARDLRAARSVAVKILLRTDREFLRRFRREAQILMTMRHPHVIAVHDVDQLGEHPYLVMEYVSGGTLRDRLGHGKMSTGETLRLGRDILRGVQACHARGVIHRDIKPDNVLLTAEGRAKLADFGIAKEQAGSGSVVTQVGALLGSPRYMSPEQVRSEECVTGSDLYSVGLVLYEMLVGKYPYSPKTMLEMMRCHEEVDPPRIESLAPEIPAPVATIVHRCLAKSLADRPDSADEVLDALAPFLPADEAPPLGDSPAPTSRAAALPAATRRFDPLILVALLLGVALAVALFS